MIKFGGKLLVCCCCCFLFEKSLPTNNVWQVATKLIRSFVVDVIIFPFLLPSLSWRISGTKDKDEYEDDDDDDDDASLWYGDDQQTSWTDMIHTHTHTHTQKYMIWPKSGQKCKPLVIVSKVLVQAEGVDSRIEDNVVVVGGWWFAMTIDHQIRNVSYSPFKHPFDCVGESEEWGVRSDVMFIFSSI